MHWKDLKSHYATSRPLFHEMALSFQDFLDFTVAPT